jgi:ApaG protein
MGTQETNLAHGIKISVQTKYSEENSIPEQNHFLFTYHIQIENKSEFTVQLLSRHWEIFDSNNEHSTVNGQGVVGEQPILGPGEIFEYESACSLETGLGKMSGLYTFERKIDNQRFNVNIPEFLLSVPYILN